MLFLPLLSMLRTHGTGHQEALSVVGSHLLRLEAPEAAQVCRIVWCSSDARYGEMSFFKEKTCFVLSLSGGVFVFCVYFDDVFFSWSAVCVYSKLNWPGSTSTFEYASALLVCFRPLLVSSICSWRFVGLTKTCWICCWSHGLCPRASPAHFWSAAFFKPGNHVHP